MSTLIDRARVFARDAHDGQSYSEGSFFDNHLSRVVATLGRFEVEDPLLLAAGWLHDVVEDTETTVDRLRSEFGPELATLVWRLTDETEGNRRERQAKTHAKIRGDVRAVCVKLADRIANVEASIEDENELLDRMYRKEYPRFREHLHRDEEFAVMWSHLDSIIGWAPEDGHE